MAHGVAARFRGFRLPFGRYRGHHAYFFRPARHRTGPPAAWCLCFTGAETLRLFEQALTLSEAEQAELVAKLLASLG